MKTFLLTSINTKKPEILGLKNFSCTQIVQTIITITNYNLQETLNQINEINELLFFTETVVFDLLTIGEKNNYVAFATRAAVAQSLDKNNVCRN